MSKGIKKVVFITGTRADFGKLKPLIKKLDRSPLFEVYIFTTGMHTLSKYGSTIIEVLKEGFKNVYPFDNQPASSDMENLLANTAGYSSFFLNKVLTNTIEGFSNYIRAIRPEMIIVHGDRVEALAAAIVGSLSNIVVTHIEGGEISGTIDELIRHAITKMSHIHFVANEKARRRVIQLGEHKEQVFVIGSPDLDIMTSKHLPSLKKARQKYEIPFDSYALFVYHSVTTELDTLEENVKVILKALVESKRNYIVIYPNNDPGSEIILEKLEKLRHHQNIRIFPSIRFEYFLTLLKNAEFIIGNSSVGVREAGFYKVPAVDIGTRQKNRGSRAGLITVSHEKDKILEAIKKVERIKLKKDYEFGDGKSTTKFFNIMKRSRIWKISPQKYFVELKN